MYFFTILGLCKCGSVLKGRILPPNDDQMINIECTASKGDGNCRKRQCRNEDRKKLVDCLKHESVESYRTNLASKVLKETDRREPPHLYSANVMRTAKYEFQQKEYRDPNPLMAVAKLKRSTEGRNVVRDIGLDPAVVYFWSNHQLRVYNALRASPDACLCIDATGNVAKHYIHVDNKKSQHMFLYHGVLHCSVGTLPVFSMFSEAQDTVTISSCLRRWIQSGAKFPLECVRRINILTLFKNNSFIFRNLT